MAASVAPTTSPSDEQAAPIPDSSRGRPLLVVALQLLLVLLVVRLFRIEERRGLFDVMTLAAGGFLLYRALPVAWRPAGFLTVSLASFPLVLGWSDAAWVVGPGLVLIGACHLPLPPFAGVGFARVGLVAAIATGLALWRSDEIAAYWPVLGSIFMFRLWIYMRELRRETKAVPWSQRLSYFFLLPNACFPFFPIISYRVFRDSYAADDAGPIAQRGVSWILRGIIHLLLYRAIKVYLLPSPLDLIDAEYLALFLVTNYALYLRISGHFHIITGLLHLYGFDLPRTHDRYFLASSLSDIWRRINIYWKDFLSEHVFLPTFFSLRRLPRAVAVVVGVGVTFVATWLLHSWQAFWLLGDFPLAGRDAALWLSAGTLVAINSLWQYRAAARGGGAAKELTVGRALVHSLQVAGTFLTVSFFWACWTVAGFPQLVAAIGQMGGYRAEALVVPAAVLVAVVTAGTVAQLVFDRLRRRGVEARDPLERSAFACVGVMTLLAVIGLPDVHAALGRSVSRTVASLTVDAPTPIEADRALRGYYEELAEANLQADPLLGAEGPSDAQRTVLYWDATRDRNDLLVTELIPGWRGTVDGVPFEVNRWGMRDDDLPRRKPPGTYRVAVLGSSITMGYDVSADADFESLLEHRLNEAMPPDGPRIELLNFAVGGYYPLHSAAALREKAFAFEPDAVYYVAHQGEFYGTPRHLATSYKSGYPLPYPCLESIVRRAGVTDETSWGTAEVRLQPHAKEIVACVYRGIVDDCRRRDVVPVCVYVPIPGVTAVTVDTAEMLSLAREAGFVVIDLSGWEGSRPADEVLAGKHHVNLLGHRLIADRLFGALRERPDALPRSIAGDSSH